MVKVPPYLQPGHTIALVCPSGFMAIEKAQTCIDVLQQWGYKVKVGTTVGSHSSNYFSGTDEERLINFQQILDDDDVHAVLCARGGYGLSRIIDHISFKKFKKQPKWVIGFSDITVLHSHIYSNCGVATLHAPMAAAFNDGGYANEFVGSLKLALEGKRLRYECPGHTFNKKGEAVGELVGGNLALLAHLVGTASDIKTKGRILFIEDVGEYLYNVDRMMRQLQRSGKLNKLAGLIIGGFSDMKDTERPFGQNVYEIIHEIVKEYDYPVSFGFPVSHEKENYALKVGMGYRLKVGKSKVVLDEYVDELD
ncbi:S66 peptidase family protein [Longitalea luteola]|uniref:S66 peptidase family protein n=1 Tax=Longitalea luteola TaxID=2812563 RepID=UPI001A96DB32|nr:LD-carboxypeptidase [Longitalea luteola]